MRATQSKMSKSHAFNEFLPHWYHVAEKGLWLRFKMHSVNFTFRRENVEVIIVQCWCYHWDYCNIRDQTISKNVLWKNLLESKGRWGKTNKFIAFYEHQNWVTKPIHQTFLTGNMWNMFLVRILVAKSSFLHFRLQKKHICNIYSPFCSLFKTTKLHTLHFRTMGN